MSIDVKKIKRIAKDRFTPDQYKIILAFIKNKRLSFAYPTRTEEQILYELNHILKYRYICDCATKQEAERVMNNEIDDTVYNRMSKDGEARFYCFYW